MGLRGGVGTWRFSRYPPGTDGASLKEGWPRRDITTCTNSGSRISRPGDGTAPADGNRACETSSDASGRLADVSLPAADRTRSGSGTNRAASTGTRDPNRGIHRPWHPARQSLRKGPRRRQGSEWSSWQCSSMGCVPYPLPPVLVATAVPRSQIVATCLRSSPYRSIRLSHLCFP